MTKWVFGVAAVVLLSGCAGEKRQAGPVADHTPDRSVPRSVERSAPTAEPRSQPAEQPAKKTVPPSSASVPPDPPDRREEPRLESSRPPADDRTIPERKSAEPQAQSPKDRVTPLDQSGSPEDIETTRRIRQALMNEDLSFGAKNVLVITDKDRVVLKGTVKSPSEADRVKIVAGMMTTKPIDDRLVVSQ